MTQGWRTPLTPEGYEDFPNHVVAVLMDRSFPEPEYVTEVLKTVPKDAVVLIRYQNKEDAPLLQAVLAAGIDPLLVGTHKYWSGYDWRDPELANTCSRVIVFRNKASDAKADWSKRQESGIWPGRIHVIVKGKAKKKPQRKGRKVE